MRRVINIIFNMLKKNIEYKSPTELVEKCKALFTERQLKENKNDHIVL